jgi:hypothetical protein
MAGVASQMYWRLVVLGLLLLEQLPVLEAADTLFLTVQPGKAVAGEPFGQQPVVQLLDSLGQLREDVNTGYILVSIEANPTGFSELIPPMDIGNYEEEQTPGKIRFKFEEGVAKLHSLYINDVGEGFTLLLISLEHAVQLTTAPFSVSLGDPYKIALSVYPGTANGGTAFQPQPTVSVQDRGGNIVTTQNSGVVTVSLFQNPVNGTLFAPENGFTLTFNGGTATFNALLIDKSGSPYMLRFDTDLFLAGDRTAFSFPFTVGVGPPHVIRFLSQPMGVKGGASFTEQPELEVLDMGMNRLFGDSESRMRAYVQNNPATPPGRLLPENDRTVELVKGVATFNNLMIDMVGNDYTLRFVLLTKVTGVAKWLPSTGLSADTNGFDVELGKPQALQVDIQPYDAWAGGGPFGIQPSISLRDLGGNILRSDGESIITAKVTVSLGASQDVVVNTVFAPTTVIGNVQVHIEPDELGVYMYGVGQVIDIEVSWVEQVVVMSNPANTSQVPRLLLELGDVDKYADCISIDTQAHIITFRYIVEDGDFTNDLEAKDLLDGNMTAWVDLNNGTVLDGNKKAASLLLPQFGTNGSLSWNNEIKINSVVPLIMNFSCPEPGSGRFGAGETLDFHLNISSPVVVFGVPRIQLDISSYADTSTYDHVRWALFKEILPKSNNQILVFEYIVQTNDTTRDQRLNFMPFQNASIDLNDDTASIRRKSTYPTTHLNYTLTGPTLQGRSLAENHKIILDTVTPKLDPRLGINTLKPAGVYTAGELIKVDVAFTEPVVVFGNPQLIMASGASERPAVYFDGSGSKVLRFYYTVDSPDETLDLDVLGDNAIDLNLGYIRRYVSRGEPVTDANLTIFFVREANTTLADNTMQRYDCEMCTPTVPNATNGTNGSNGSVLVSRVRRMQSEVWNMLHRRVVR